MNSAATTSDQMKATDTRSRVVAAACVGAVLGGVWGWLYLTSSGARVRDRLDPVFDGAADVLDHVQTFRAVSTRVTALVVLFVAAVLVPQTARADAFVVPWIGGNVGPSTGAGLVDIGANFGMSALDVVDVDADFGYSPDYFGRGVSSSLVTAMGNVTLGLPFGKRGAPRFRPYVTGGLGLIRSRLEIVPTGYRMTRDDFGVALGGGLTAYASDHVGVRADLRYLQTLEETVSGDAFSQIGAGRLHFWRTSIGLVIR
jgi:outer membrane protein with beta-barrel domain